MGFDQLREELDRAGQREARSARFREEQVREAAAASGALADVDRLHELIQDRLRTLGERLPEIAPRYFGYEVHKQCCFDGGFSAQVWVATPRRAYEGRVQYRVDSELRFSGELAGKRFRWTALLLPGGPGQPAPARQQYLAGQITAEVVEGWLLRLRGYEPARKPGTRWWPFGR